MRTNFQKIFIGAIAVAVVAYLGFQVYRFARPEYQVETATLYTAYDDVAVTGYMIRDEQIIPKETSGVCNVVVSDGERVSRNGLIANVYQSEAQADASEQIRRMDEKLRLLQNSTVDTALGADEVAAMEDKICAAIRQIGAAADSGNGTAILAAREDLTLLINKKGVLLGESEGYDAVIAKLKEERAVLAAQSAGGAYQARSPISGFFVSEVDGYEDMLSVDRIKELSVDDLRSLGKIAPSEVDNDAVFGKIVPGYEWYFAALLSEKEADGLKIGGSMQIKFTYSTGDVVPADIYYISEAEDGQRVVVLRCDYSLPELSLVRTQKVQLIRRSYTGLKISEQSLHVNEEGQKGVYIQVGSIMQWRPVDILFSKDNYHLVTYDKSSKNGLQLYDMVIVGGRDLYNGKVWKP